ncbi:MAG: FprA family A-type flavoprotein [Lachnospiraceae bacterium]|nr:FprA family A-type flavoprotein [Lachnospiraceae bacterium]
MKDMHVSDSVAYVGVDDTTLDLFESQYKIPYGVSYNSYIIFDEKIAVMDTVDPRGTDEWLANVRAALNGRRPDYLVVQHLEPDHAGSIRRFIEEYPEVTLVGNQKTFPMIEQFFEIKLAVVSADASDSSADASGTPEAAIQSVKTLTVAEGSTLSLGSHTLQFFMAPFVHWPEVMVTYEQTEKLLFSADGFGTFGALSSDVDWITEARRYYINIVGKYGPQVQTLLKKASGLSIAAILPLHGPVLKENLGYYIDKYLTWSSYTPEEEGIVIAYASLHGNTAKAVRRFEEILRQKGVENIAVFDLNRDDMSVAIEYAYRYDRLVLASVTYDASLFPAMEDFLYHLKIKNFQNRKVGYIQNGSWVPASAKLMKAHIAGMKNMTEVEPVVTIRSALSAESLSQLEALADALL